ncbi:26S proteasome non-ATPase regulatory subunit 10-like protein [Chytriomyces sp. MP71]|nr:26S proteasome non-ATPase regulatory subunit 10-like protein [Chytriomyces sp. MP71]KAI8612581.1 26S proteasome non-ATPase regulatory subunit 10-like protein [Chytriomyces sp. MP71]
MIATSVGSAPFADFLLQREADVNLANENKQTPLFYAASKGWLNICELLISRGARINVRDHLRQTPLHRACAKGNLACVKLLLAQPNIQLDHEDRDGNTALHIAVENGYGEVAVLLVEGGADVESQNGEKKRPLDLVPDKQLKVYLERAWAAVGNK